MPLRIKLDHPFKDENEVLTMVEQFENCTWPYERWTHRAHLGVAIIYLQKYSFDAAVDRARQHINLYNKTCGDPTGYHETITLLYMRRVARSLAESDASSPISESVERFAADFGMNWPLKYYSSARLWSDEAKSKWVEPDLMPLDF